MEATILNNAKKGDKFITRSGKIVTFVEDHHINNHKVIMDSKGETYLVTQYGIAMHLRNDLIQKA